MWMRLRVEVDRVFQQHWSIIKNDAHGGRCGVFCDAQFNSNGRGIDGCDTFRLQCRIYESLAPTILAGGGKGKRGDCQLYSQYSCLCFCATPVVEIDDDTWCRLRSDRAVDVVIAINNRFTTPAHLTSSIILLLLQPQSIAQLPTLPLILDSVPRRTLSRTLHHRSILNSTLPFLRHSSLVRVMHHCEFAIRRHSLPAFKPTR
ncbi:hypothetical protein CPC08DRAFT_120464 [Agrocybe pediades]|nr:hypothetical protein CPC08DRAFT_120464 [Agrocybe pediades]